MRVGDMTIDAVVDGVARIPATAAYAGTGGSQDDWAPHQQFLDDAGNIELALGGFLVRSGDRVVLVDAGVGRINSGGFAGGQLIDSLGALGVQPADVTDVVFTHLHFDHVGWATQQGAVVFTNATYRCDERDWSHFVGPDASSVQRNDSSVQRNDSSVQRNDSSVQRNDSSVQRDAGATKKLSPLTDRLDAWSGSGHLLPGIDLLAAAGHTPGSTIVVLSSGTERAMLLGDVVHCPVELLDDEWGGLGDVDPELARRTRVALARELEGTDTPVAAAHFPGMQFGRLLAAEGKRSWVV